MNAITRTTCCGLLLCSLAGCSGLSATSHEHYMAQSLTPLSAWSYEQSDEMSEVVYLTDIINDPTLHRLVEQAMSNNPGLKQTALSLQIAYLEEAKSWGSRLPTASLSFSGSRSETSDTRYNAGFSARWELDLWRKLADTQAASGKAVDQVEADYQGARDALAANIMRQWLTFSLYHQQIAIEERRLDALVRIEQSITDRYRQGLGSLRDLDSARTNTSSVRASLVQYQENLRKSQRSLSVLLGQLNPTLTLPDVAAYPDVLVPLSGVPDQDLARRPDLRTAYASLEKQQLNANIAYKAMLPSISLSMSLSEGGATPSESLFVSPVWSLLSGLSAPVFQGGKLRASAEIADMRTEQAYERYRSTLINAVKEVEDALSDERSLATQQTHLEKALSSAKRSEANYQDRYRKGLVDIRALLSAQQQSNSIERQLVSVKHNRLINRIDLGLALGLGVKNGI